MGGKLKAVKLEEEALLLRFYAGKAQAMCRAFHFPAKVAPTALAYLQRFFTRASVLDHHPRDVMLAAVYVACKVGHRCRCPVCLRALVTCLWGPYLGTLYRLAPATSSQAFSCCAT